MTIKNIAYLFFSVCVLCFALISATLAWTTPTSTPPNNNVSAPINVGSTAQGKMGNLGIGNTSPVSPLSVGSSSQFQVDSSGNLIKLNNITYSWPSSQGAASTYLKNNGSGTLTWEAPTNLWTDQGTYIYPNNYTNFLILDNGSVNIGTTAVTSGVKLTVSGGYIKIVDGTQGSGKVLTSDSSGLATWQTPATSGVTGTGTANYFPYWTSSSALSGTSPIYYNSGNIGIGTTSPAYALQIGASTKGFGFQTSGTAVDLNSLGVSLYINSGSSSYNTYLNTISGNVGIGTSSPLYKLQVGTSSKGFGFQTSGTAVDFNPLGVDLYINSGSSSYNTYLNTTSGNVGIGTASPSYKLQIGANTKGFGFQTSGTAVDFNSLSVPLYINSGGQNTYLNNTGGYVGIGTTSPGTNTLQIGTSSKGFGFFLGGTAADFNSLSVPLYINSGGQNTYLNNTGGYVGIGTTSPGTNTLQIGTSSKGFGFYLQGSAADLKSLGQPMYINADGQNTYINPNSGNVGIGTTSPGAKLDINGAIRIQGGSPANGYILKSTNGNGDAIWYLLNCTCPSGQAIQSVKSDGTCVCFTPSC
jgi:hypothetical protein